MAKAEGEIAFNALFDRLGNLSLREGSVRWRADNLQFRGLESMELEFDVAPAAKETDPVGEASTVA